MGEWMLWKTCCILTQTVELSSMCAAFPPMMATASARRCSSRAVPFPVSGATIQKESAESGRLAVDQSASLCVISDGNRMEDLDPEILAAYQLDRRAADMFHLVTGQPLDENSDGRRHPWMG